MTWLNGKLATSLQSLYWYNNYLLKCDIAAYKEISLYATVYLSSYFCTFTRQCACTHTPGVTSIHTHNSCKDVTSYDEYESEIFIFGGESTWIRLLARLTRTCSTTCSTRTRVPQGLDPQGLVPRLVPRGESIVPPLNTSNKDVFHVLFHKDACSTRTWSTRTVHCSTRRVHCSAPQRCCPFLTVAV